MPCDPEAGSGARGPFGEVGGAVHVVEPASGTSAGLAEEHRRFTPAASDRSRCLARVWGGGRGGQCTSRRVAGKDFCRQHLAAGSLACGVLTGAIPYPKSRQFKRAAAQAAERLEAAGISHRDIREMNILVDNNKPVLIDFGWAMFEGEAGIFTPENLEAPDDRSAIDQMLGRVLGEAVQN